MSFMALSPFKRSKLYDLETTIKERQMDRVRNMSITELKGFSKHQTMVDMIDEIQSQLPDVAHDIIKDSCLPISNALNNECQRMSKFA